MRSGASSVKDNGRLLEIPDSLDDSFLTVLPSLLQYRISTGRDCQGLKICTAHYESLSWTVLQVHPPLAFTLLDLGFVPY